VFVQRDWLKAQLEAGKSLEEIGRELGKDHSTVGYWIRKHGLVAGGRAKYAPRGGIDAERLRKLVDSGLTIRRLAEELACSTSTVIYWLRQHGLKTARSHAPVEVDASGDAHGECRRHGRSRFVQRKDDGYYRCAQCRSEDVARRRRRVKQILVDEAGGACFLCGYDRYVGALQFHHLEPSAKAFSLSHGGVTRSLELARAEARKCVLLCSNCHAEVEAGIVSPTSDGAPRQDVPHSCDPG